MRKFSRCSILMSFLLLPVGRAAAEPVTYKFTGHVGTVSKDLGDSIKVNDPVSGLFRYESSSPMTSSQGTPSSGTASYSNALIFYELTVGTYSVDGTDGSMVRILNNWNGMDVFTFTSYNVGGPPLNGYSPDLASLGLAVSVWSRNPLDDWWLINLPNLSGLFLQNNTWLGFKCAEGSVCPSVSMWVDTIKSLPSVVIQGCPSYDPVDVASSPTVNIGVFAAPGCPITWQSVPNGPVVLDTGQVGTQSLVASATDACGQSATESCEYQVRYAFDGFLPPVRNWPSVNSVMAGSTVPVKWRLPDGHGGYFCDPNVVIGMWFTDAGNCDEAVAASSIPLLVESNGISRLWCDSDDQLHYNWKIDRSLAGASYSFFVALNDGSTRCAYFTVK